MRRERETSLLKVALSVCYQLTILPLAQRQQSGNGLKWKLLQLTGHRLALRAGSNAWGGHHPAGTRLLPNPDLLRCQRDGWETTNTPAKGYKQRIIISGDSINLFLRIFLKWCRGKLEWKHQNFSIKSKSHPNTANTFSHLDEVKKYAHH